MRQNETNNTTQETSADQNGVEQEVSVARSSRRRFVVRAAAAPVVLTVAGRSALATTNCQDIPKGLSPMAWLSVHPKKGTTACVSHTVTGSPLGKSPGYWTPNKNGRCFQGPWPTNVNPFLTCWRVKQKATSTSPAQYQQVNWAPGSWGSYSDMLYYYPENTQTDAGWNTGTSLSWLDTRSLSKILIDETASQGIKWHICAAYLNALAFPYPAYALTPQDVQDLYTNHKLPGGYLLSDSEINSYLDQTWA